MNLNKKLNQTFQTPVFMLLFFIILILSCNDSVFEPVSLNAKQSQTSSLKAASLNTRFFVSKSGNDNNDGSSESPFLTIVRASEVAKPGDVVIVRDGVYTATTLNMNMLSCSGSPDNYITFQSETKYGAVLDGNNESDYCFSLVYGASYLKFIDFEIRNFLRVGFDINHPGYISSFITVQGCKILNIGRIADTGNIGRCGFYIGQKNHHITMDKNLIYNIGRTGPDDYWLVKDHAIYTGTAANSADAGHHNVIINNIIFGCSGNALNIGSMDDLIANNVMAWTNENNRGGFCFIATEGAGGKNLTIANNIFYQPPVSNPYAIVSYSGYSGWSVKHNMVFGGSMFYLTNSQTVAAMQGGNYGMKDCERGEVNPLFVNAVRANAPNVDFRLLPESPAINSGVDVGLNIDNSTQAIYGPQDIGPMNNASELLN